MKPGWKTSEMYVALLGLFGLMWVLTGLLALLPEIVATIPASSNPAYAGLFGLGVTAATGGIGYLMKGLVTWYGDIRAELKLQPGALPLPPGVDPLSTKPPAIAPLVIALLCLGLAIPAPARAQALWSSGPTLPLMEVRPGNPHPVSLAAGAGYQLNLTWAGAQKALFGKSWDMLSFNAMAFGTAVSSSSGSSFGALSAALGVCTLSSLLCVGAGHDLITSNGTTGGFFGIFAFSINFGTAPKAPPAGVDKGPLGLPRGNTLYFGSV